MVTLWILPSFINEILLATEHVNIMNTAKFINDCSAKGLSAVCDCGISWSYSLTIF